MKTQNFDDMTGQNQLRTNSDATPREVYEGQLHLVTISHVISGSQYHRWRALSKRRIEMGLCYYLQLLSGARISEILSIKWQHLYMNIGFTIKGKKGSRSRLVVAPGYEKWFTARRSKLGDVFHGMNYNNVYREYLRVGIKHKNVNSQRYAVTHFNRYNFIDNLDMAGLTTKEIQDILGHNSEKSTKGYLDRFKT